MTQRFGFSLVALAAIALCAATAETASGYSSPTKKSTPSVHIAVQPAAGRKTMRNANRSSILPTVAHSGVWMAEQSIPVRWTPTEADPFRRWNGFGL